MEPPPISDWLSLLLITAILIIISFLWLKRRTIPPGPMGLPIVGFYPFLKNDDIYSQFDDFRSRYGDIFSFRTLGGQLVVIVNGSAIQELFVERAEVLGRPQTLNVLNYFDDSLGIAQSEGEYWKDKRAFFLRAVRDFGFGKTESEDYVQQLINEMIEDIQNSGGEPFDARQKVVFVTGNHIAKTMCDKRFETNDPEFVDMIKGFDHIVGGGLHTFFLVGMFFRLFLSFTATGRTRTREVARLREVVAKIIDNHVKTFDQLHHRDFIDAYLSHMMSLEKNGKLKGSSYSLDALNAITLNMLMEGTESTAGTIVGFLFKLAEFPDVQKRIQKEVDEVIGRSRTPTYADKRNMPYLEAVILELFRTAMFLYLTVFYSNIEEVRIRGYRIPKRSLISANFHTISYDPKLYPDPSNFDPERFLGADGKRSKDVKSPVAFGTGKRTCVGENFAQMEIFLIFASLMQNFTLYPGDGGFQIRAVPRPPED